jgi:hypothetical protein
VSRGILSKKVGIQVVVAILSLSSVHALRSFLPMLRLECGTFPYQASRQICLGHFVVVFSILNVDRVNLLCGGIVDAYLNAPLLSAGTNVYIILKMYNLKSRIVLILWCLRF